MTFTTATRTTTEKTQQLTRSVRELVKKIMLVPALDLTQELNNLFSVKYVIIVFDIKREYLRKFFSVFQNSPRSQFIGRK